MPIREVALDRDVRSPRLLPSATRLLSSHVLRRALSISVLLVIDVCSLLLSCVLVALLSGPKGSAFWHGFSWWGFAGSCVAIILVSAFNSLYGRRHARHKVRKVLKAWAIALLMALMLLLALDPLGIEARLVVAWLLASLLSVGARFLYDALVSLAYGANADDPPALLLGSLDSCLAAMLQLAALSPESRVTVVGLVVPAGQGLQEHNISGVPPIVATSDHLRDAVQGAGAEEVIIADQEAVRGHLLRHRHRPEDHVHEPPSGRPYRQSRPRLRLPAVLGAPAARGWHQLHLETGP